MFEDLLYDKIEDTKSYKDICDEVDKQTELKLSKLGYKSQRGYCHIFWKTKKEILKNSYGIDWQTPSEMNPMVLFD